MKLIIAGGRHYKPTFVDLVTIATLFKAIGPTEIVSGGANGADRFGEQLASAMRLNQATFHAEWNKLGKAAGPVRNAQMAEYADACILLPGGAGTDSMFDHATKANIPIYDLRKKENQS